MVKKIATWGGIAFLLFFIAFRPQSAAAVFSSLGNDLKDIAESFRDFIGSLIA